MISHIVFGILKLLVPFSFLKACATSAKVYFGEIMANKVRSCKWIANGVNGFLLDVYGVLYDSGSSDVPITGSIEAVKK